MTCSWIPTAPLSIFTNVTVICAVSSSARQAPASGKPEQGQFAVAAIALLPDWRGDTDWTVGCHVIARVWSRLFCLSLDRLASWSSGWSFRLSFISIWNLMLMERMVLSKFTPAIPLCSPPRALHSPCVYGQSGCRHQAERYSVRAWDPGQSLHHPGERSPPKMRFQSSLPVPANLWRYGHALCRAQRVASCRYPPAPAPRCDLQSSVTQGSGLIRFVSILVLVFAQPLFLLLTTTLTRHSLFMNGLRV